MKTPPNLGGCDFAADPTLAAGIADVFWSPLSPLVIPVLPLPPELVRPDEAVLGLPRVRAAHTLRDGVHLVPTDGAPQLWLVEGTTGSGTPSGVLMPLDASLPARMEALLVLWRRMSGRPAAIGGVTPARHRRFVLGLRALDARADGASYRTLAAALFGADRAPKGAAWKTHDLRSRTLRIVADATALMRGGYRALVGLPPRP